MAMGRNRIKLSFLLVAFAIAVPCLNAGIAEEDNYTKQQEEQARQAAENAYTPDPESIAQELYKQTRRSDLDSTNSTRRSLGKKYTGPCKVTNPIDKCWRCDPNWAKDRKKLAKCAMGFGRKTTGGLKGQYYLVTDSSDNDLVNPKPGTFRHAVVQNRPLWIIFSKSMVITLQKELMITSNKTIDGRGHNVQFSGGAGLTVFLSSNVIIHNVKIYNIVAKDGGIIRDSETHYGVRTPSDGDGISIFGGSNVWIDHISMSNCADGLVDAIRGSTAITISNCHFTDHDHVMLFGASDTYNEDKLMQVTVAFNHFGKGLVQRMPRCRFGFFHVVNNDYTHWLMYAIGGSANATIISQGNRFIAPPNDAAKEIAHRINAKEEVWKKWQWRSENDLLMNNATFLQSGPPLKHEQVTGENMITAKHGNDVTWITRFSGVLNCVEGKPC